MLSRAKIIKKHLLLFCCFERRKVENRTFNSKLFHRLLVQKTIRILRILLVFRGLNSLCACKFHTQLKFLYRPKAIHCNYQLSILAVFVEYLRQFLIDLNQIYRHYSSVPKHVSVNFFSFLAQAVSEHGAAATFLSCCACHGVANPSTASH